MKTPFLYLIIIGDFVILESQIHQFLFLILDLLVTTESLFYAVRVFMKKQILLTIRLCSLQLSILEIL